MPRLKKGAIIDPGENWPAFDGGFTMEASGSAGAGQSFAYVYSAAYKVGRRGDPGLVGFSWSHCLRRMWRMSCRFCGVHHGCNTFHLCQTLDEMFDEGGAAYDPQEAAAILQVRNWGF